MTWTLVGLLAAGSFGFKVLGMVVIGDRALPPALDRCLTLIPAAVIAALIIKDTFANGQQLGIDARAVGVAGAVIAAWRKAPMVAVICIGAGLTASVRALS